MITAPIGKTLTGKISLNPKGFGFARCADGCDAFVPPGDASRFLSGDTISFRMQVDRRGKPSATCVTLVQGNSDLIVGTVRYDAASGERFLVSEDFNHLPLVVRNSLVVADDVVVAARVVHRPFEGKAAPGTPVQVEIERVIGARGSISFDREYALARNSLESQFTSAVLASAYKAVNDFSGPHRHLSMTDIDFVTIDGASTRDIDDAVYVANRSDAPGFVVYVAIADVSHYVRPGSLVDQEAARRATSVYLPGQVVPMLPENLSNGVCSLSPNVDRFAVVLKITLDNEGSVVAHDYTRAVIRSRGAVTYEAVSRMLDAEDVSGLPPLPAAAHESLRRMHSLHLLLQASRDRVGRIDLDGPSITVTQHANGNWSKIVEERNTAERCVESMMLLANYVTARHLFAKGVGIYRVQPAPSQEGWVTFRSTVFELYGLEVASSTPSIPAVLELLSKYDKGSEEYSVILSAFQSNVPRASYSSVPAPHFSLNAAGYTQFTSPIRRYADLAVHRLILEEGSAGDTTTQQVAEKCTDMSSRSSLAEFDLTDKAKKVIYLTEFANLPLDERPVERSQVVRNTKRGLRLRIPSQQFTVFLGEDELMRAGFAYDTDTDRWMRPNDKPVVPGCHFNVRMASWAETNKSFELNVTLA